MDKKLSKGSRKKAAVNIEQLSFIVESMHDAVVMTNTNREIVYMNRAAEKMLGRTAEEMIGKKAAPFFEGVPGNPPNLTDTIARQAKMKPWHGEIFERRKDGTIFPIRLMLDIVRDGKGKAIGYVGFSRDITEQRKAEEALKESREKFRMLFDNANDAIFIADAETGIFMEANKEAERLLGRSRQEILGMHQLQIHPADKLEYYRDKFRRHIREGRVADFEAEIVTKNGTIVPVLISAAVMELQGEKVIQGIFRDISEHKRAEDAIRESEERYRSVVDNIGVGIALISPSMEIISINPQMKEWFPHIDTSKQPLCYRSFNDPPREAACSYCPTRKTLSDGKVHESVTETPAGDEIRNYRIISSPIKGWDGKIVAAIEMVEDITEQRWAEEALRKSEERYRSLTEDVLDSSLVGIFILDSDFKIVWVNKALERYFGLKREEVIGKDKRSLIRSGIKNIFADSQGFASKVLATYDDNTYMEHFECHVLPDGDREERWLEHWSQPIRSGLYARGRVEHYTEITELKRTEEALRHRTYELGERVKELECLYGISDLIGEEDISLGEIFQNTVNLIPPALQYPAVACARIILDGQEFVTTGYKETEWKHSSNINTYGKRAGSLEVCYLEEIPGRDKGSFQEEEKSLINAIAERLGRMIEHKQAKERLLKLNQCFLAMGQDGRKNIEIIVRSAGELLGGACMLYNRLEKERGLLCTWGIWQEPEGYKAEDHPEGHICYDVIAEGRNDALIIEDLTGTKYEKTDPNVKKYKLKSYLGYPVRLKGKVVGSLCLCDMKRRTFTETEIGIVSMLAQAVAIEEERKLAEEVIVRSRERLRAIIDTVPGVVYTALPDKNSTTTFISAAFEKLLGYHPNELLEDPTLWGSLIHPEDRDRCWAAIKEHRKKKTLLEIEYRMLHKDGRIIHFLNRATPVLDSDGNILKIEGIMVDISQRKELQERIAQSEKLSAIGEMVAGIAHELNNPLGIISGHVQLLLSKVKDKSIRSRLKKIITHVERGTKIIQNLLSFARKRELKLAPGDINATLEEALDNVRSEFPASDIVVKKNLAEGLPSMSLDHHQMQIVFMNIIKNSYQTLMKIGEKGKIYLQSSKTNGSVIIRIEDTGPGVEPATLKNFFNPFFTTKKAGEGTGLGLSIAYGIVKEHGGTINAANAPGDGVEITVELPLRGADKAPTK